MSKENKFKFVNNQDEQFLEEDSDLKKDDIILESEEELLKKKKKQFRKKVIKGAIFMFFASAALFGFALFWGADTSLMGITDALWFAALVEFGIGWMIFVYNKNIFSSIIYGTTTFGRMIVGKKIKEDYYTYMKKVESNPVPKFYYILPFISALILLIPAIILLFIV